MAKLSPEELSIILAHLLAKPTQERPSVYGPVARSWQSVVEAFPFGNITIKSKEIHNLARFFSGSGRHRRCLLRQLNYNIGLPIHGGSREDHATNERAFGSTIRSLFNLLESWDKEYDGKQDGRDGSIPVTWRSRPRLQLHLWLSHHVDTKNADGPLDLAFDVCNSSAARRYHTLLPEFNVSQVQCVTSFGVGVTLGCAPHPATLCQIASLLPSLQSLDLTYWDPAIKRHDIRKDHRVALGNELRALSSKLPKLERLCIRWQDGLDPSNHSFACGDLQRGGVDMLCDAIRHLAENCQLKELQLENIMISPDLFRHSPSGKSSSPLMADQKPPTFPNLKRFDIKSGILGSNGKWYYTGDPASVEASEGDLILDDDDTEGDIDSDDSGDEDNSTRDRFVNGERPHYEWRTRPDPETFNPLIQDLTDTMLKRMPSLQWARLEIGYGLDEFVGITIQYCEAGQPSICPPGKRRKRPWVEDITVRRCKTWVGKGSEWDIPSDVIATWREWAGASGSVETGVWLCGSEKSSDESVAPFFAILLLFRNTILARGTVLVNRKHMSLLRLFCNRSQASRLHGERLPVQTEVPILVHGLDFRIFLACKVRRNNTYARRTYLMTFYVFVVQGAFCSWTSTSQPMTLLYPAPGRRLCHPPDYAISG